MSKNYKLILALTITIITSSSFSRSRSFTGSEDLNGEVQCTLEQNILIPKVCDKEGCHYKLKVKTSIGSYNFNLITDKKSGAVKHTISNNDDSVLIQPIFKGKSNNINGFLLINLSQRKRTYCRDLKRKYKKKHL